MVEIINLYWNDQIEWFKKNFNKTYSNNYKTDCEQIKNALENVINNSNDKAYIKLKNDWLNGFADELIKKRCNIDLIDVENKLPK